MLLNPLKEHAVPPCLILVIDIVPISSRDMVLVASPPTEVKATGDPVANTPGLPLPASVPPRMNLPLKSKRDPKQEPGG